MNYRELRSAAENDITALNFCSLVDAADKLHEEEISNCHTEMKNSVTRSNPQRDHQNLDGASTSSSRNPSLLPDLNTIKSYRELRSAAENDISSRRFCALVDVARVLHEEEEEERDKRIFRLFPRKTRTSVKNGVSRKKNLDWGSTSSSRKPSLLPDLNMIPPDEGYPRNPNSSSSLLLLDLNTIPADSESADITDKKLGREIPESLVLLMNDVNENVIKRREKTDLRLIFQRRLFETDVNPKYGRLLMPFNKLIRNDFLKPVELRYLRSIEQDINNDKKTGIGAVFFDQRNVKWGVMLKRWEKEGTWNYYVLTCGWNDIVKSNGLKQGVLISIWSFRWGGVLCFALVTPPPSMAPK